jgi:aerobic carbon-monoxide dehydrogenase medium subunit
MKPAPFTYLAPRSLEDAVGELSEHGADARVLAGGQSLVRLMNARLATPSVLVDINRIPGLDGIDATDGVLRIGALVRQRASELSPVIATEAPLFAEAGAHVGHASVRKRGTVVGSVAFADPSAELPAALLAADGEAVALGPGGERTIPADELFAGPFTTTLRPGELLTALRVPRAGGPGTGHAFVEVARRHGDLPVCGVAAVLRLDDAGRVGHVRIALCGVDERPVRARAAEDLLAGGEPGEEAFAEAAARAAADVTPRADAHGSAGYRRHLARVLTRRCLHRALHRAQEGAPDA